MPTVLPCPFNEIYATLPCDIHWGYVEIPFHWSGFYLVRDYHGVSNNVENKHRQVMVVPSHSH